MPTGYVDPNGDIATGGAWNPPSPEIHYTLINKAVRQPTAPSTSTYISSVGDISGNDAYDMTTISNATTVSRVKIWTYGNQTGSDSRVSITMYIGGNMYDGGFYRFSSSGYNSWSWESTTFDGSWTQANLNDIRIDLNDTPTVGETIQIASMYGEITYSYAVIGDSLGWAFGF